MSRFWLAVLVSAFFFIKANLDHYFDGHSLNEDVTAWDFILFYLVVFIVSYIVVGIFYSPDEKDDGVNMTDDPTDYRGD